MSTYFARAKSASTPVSTNGIYFGVVRRVDTNLNRVWVEIARLNRGFQFGPLAVVGPVLPVVGDRVACEFVEDKTNDLVVLGVVKNAESVSFLSTISCTSTSRPIEVAEGTLIFETNTNLSFQFVEGEWIPFGGGSGVQLFERTASYGEDPEVQAYEMTSGDVGGLLLVSSDISEGPSNPLVEVTVAGGVGSLGDRVEFLFDFFFVGSLAFAVNEAGDALFLPPLGKLAAPRDSGSLVVATKIYEDVEIDEVFVDVWLLSGDLADDV